MKYDIPASHREAIKQRLGTADLFFTRHAMDRIDGRRIKLDDVLECLLFGHCKRGNRYVEGLGVSRRYTYGTTRVIVGEDGAIVSVMKVTSINKTKKKTRKAWKNV